MKTKNTSAKKHQGANDPRNKVMGDLNESICIMENVTHLLRFYRNGLDGAENWHGLSLILGDVLDTMIEAREFIEHKGANSQAL